MTATTLTRTAGVVGGLAWLVGAVAQHHGGSDAAVDALHWGGLALVAIAVLGIGAGLVSGLAALRVLVAVCLAALVWSVLEALHGQYDDAWVDGGFGVALALFCLAGLARRRRVSDRSGAGAGDRSATPRPRRTGSHAA